MKWPSTFLAASLGVAAAHGGHEGQHAPKLLGARNFMAKLDMRKAFASEEHIVAREPAFGPENRKRSDGRQKRQGGGTDGQCGPGYGSCDPGYCCSAEGWCGKGQDYCTAPDCLLSYGPGCDANKKPAGADTSAVSRPKVGAVPYGGAGIYDCVNSNSIALTFDDGPYIYTNDLLDKLKSYGAKATFFITGNNLGKGMINDPNSIYPNILRRMANEGHQIASHTWSHQNASAISTTQFTNQMIWNEIAFNSVLGFFPAYMRPPFSICEKTCQTILAKLGYHVIYFDLDTEGYLHDDPTQIQTSKNIWDQTIQKSNPSKDSFLQIEHDIHYQTVYNLTDYILTSLFSHGYRSVTVGECLGDPRENWYRTGPSGGSVPSNPPSSNNPPTPTTSQPAAPPSRTPQPTSTGGPTRVSQDGSCGNGLTCTGSRFGSCCSLYGFCGTGDDYCMPENGCQIPFGQCTGVDGQPPAGSSPGGPSPSNSAPSPGNTITPSVNGLCGLAVGQTCIGSVFGACCGPTGRCNQNTISCLSILGCQKNYGYCI